MPLQSFVVRQLKQVGRPAYEDRGPYGHRDPVGGAAAVAGRVFEIEAQEIRLSADEVAGWLAARELRTTDLIFIDGSWMTIAQSPPFFEIAEPHARRERRIQIAKGTLTLFVFISIYALIFYLRLHLRFR